MPTVKSYDDLFLRSLVKEVRRNNAHKTGIALKDYGVLRDEVRILRGEDVDVTR